MTGVEAGAPSRRDRRRDHRSRQPDQVLVPHLAFDRLGQSSAAGRSARCLWFLQCTHRFGRHEGRLLGRQRHGPSSSRTIRLEHAAHALTIGTRCEWPNGVPVRLHHELSFLLPYFLKEGRGKLDVYFSRVYNPVWTNPDGFSWIEALTDEEKVKSPCGDDADLVGDGPWFADYVLPMGVSAERHDITSYETHAGRWVSFRQPTFRRFAEIQNDGSLPEGTRTFEYNPGEVWEENEFWVDLSWKIDPDGSLGIREWFQSPDDAEKPLSVDEYYGKMFENEVPGLAEAAAEAGETPLEYMRNRSAFAVPTTPTSPTSVRSAPTRSKDARRTPTAVYRAPGTPGSWDGDLSTIGDLKLAPLGDGSPAVEIGGEAKEGFPTRRRSSSCSRPRSRSGAGPSTPRRSGSRATCTGKTSTCRATSGSCSRRSGSRP